MAHKTDLSSAVSCRQCIESTHLSTRLHTYRSPNGLRLSDCPVYECSRLHDRCRATSYRILDTRHTLWSCGHSSTRPGSGSEISNWHLVKLLIHPVPSRPKVYSKTRYAHFHTSPEISPNELCSIIGELETRQN